MLNKPKFMSPSINMYGNSVIDLNSDTIPFSCIVDGNEAITDFQIVISKLNDNTIVFDTGMQELDKPFFPINNRNQNVMFTVDLKDYFTKTLKDGKEVLLPYTLNTSSIYNKNITYYTYDEDTQIYTEYNYTNSYNWNLDYPSLYIFEFKNSSDAFYWNIVFKNSNSNTKVNSAPEVFYANSIPETVVYYSYDNNFIDSSANYVKAGEEYDEDITYYKLSDGVYTKYTYDEDTWEEDRESLYYISFTELNDDLILSTDKDNMSVLSKRKIYFKSTYNQSEDVLLKRYGWRLTDTTNNYVVMDTISQNQIYGIVDDISCVCNGLINQTTYLLELYIETQNGYFDVLQSIEFKVDYMVKNVNADFEVVALNDTSGIMLNWSNIRTTEGVVVGNTVSYTKDFPVKSSASIEIPEDTSIVFEGNSNDKDLKIDENSYVVLSFQFDKSQTMTLFEMTGNDEYANNITRKLEYISSSNILKYTLVKGDMIAICEKELTDTIGELCWYVATLYPLVGGVADYKLIQSTSLDGLYPNEDLFPEDICIYDAEGEAISGEYNAATQEYDSHLTYFTIIDGEFVEYEYDEDTWDTTWENLYCCLHSNFGEWDAIRVEEVV